MTDRAGLLGLEGDTPFSFLGPLERMERHKSWGGTETVEGQNP